MKFMIEFLALSLGALMVANPVYSQPLPEQLKPMMEQLQKTPDDNALRESIINLARQQKPAPAIQEEARRSFVRGNTAFSEAKGPDDYARAVQRYEEALLIAPWWGDPYFNLAKALELRQEYSRAIQSLKFFVLTGPAADDARKAQDYSYALEDKQDKLAKEKANREAAARAEDAKYGWLLGNWRVHYRFYGGQTQWDASIQASRNGNQVIFTYTSGGVGTMPDGSQLAFPLDPNAQPKFRSTFGESGNVDWQYDFGTGPAQCPTQIGWQKVNAVVSSDRRNFSITFPSMSLYSVGGCTPGGDYYHEFTFKRE